MSDTSVNKQTFKRGFIHVSDRASTIEEDEWAFDWVLREFQRGRNEGFAGCSLAVVFVMTVLAVGLGGIAGQPYALAAVAIASLLLLYIMGRYIIQGLRKPFLSAVRPLGKIITVRFSVQRAWGSQEPHPDSKHGSGVWFMRIAPGVHILTVHNPGGRSRLITKDEFLPGSIVEFDLFVKEWKRGTHSEPFGFLIGARSYGHVEIESQPVGKGYPLKAMYCLDGFGMTPSARHFREHAGEADHDNMPSNGEEFIGLDLMLMELEHPVYHDLCEIIDKRIGGG